MNTQRSTWALSVARLIALPRAKGKASTIRPSRRIVGKLFRIVVVIHHTVLTPTDRLADMSGAFLYHSSFGFILADIRLPVTAPRSCDFEQHANDAPYSGTRDPGGLSRLGAHVRASLRAMPARATKSDRKSTEVDNSTGLTLRPLVSELNPTVSNRQCTTSTRL